MPIYYHFEKESDFEMTDSPKQNPFEALGLTKRVCDALNPKRYVEPTPIQSAAIPLIIQGHDVKVMAPTGTGKTAAFALPILHHLQSSEPHGKIYGPRALILVPTRELAEQVGEEVKKFRKFLKPRSFVIVGGVGMDKQIELLEKNPEVVVATPGRLLDLIERDALTLENVEHWVLDEADRMLDVGFSREIMRVQAELSAKTKVYLFSATFPQVVDDLCNQLLTDPKEVSVGKENEIPQDIDHAYLEVDADRKREILSFLLEYYNYDRVLVFVQTKTDADGLSSHLVSKAFKAKAIHGDKRTGERRDILKSFKEGETKVLIATDVAARGIDLKALPAVINFDLPFQSEDYVHRIGRTGRAGEKGLAISLVQPSQRGLKGNIEIFIKDKLKDLADLDMSLSMILPNEDVKKQKRIFYNKKKKK